MSKSQITHNNRMQPDFGELALPSAADARRYVYTQHREQGSISL
jgi:hypothetical protein